MAAYRFILSSGVMRFNHPLAGAHRQRLPPVHAVGTAAEVKTKFKSLAGTRGGLDKSEEEKRAVLDFVKQLQDVSPSKPAEQVLTGTTWKLLFTNSEGQSAGKIGPFVGSTLQLFPADRPGEYINTLNFANDWIKIELEGIYEVGADDKIDLEFKFVRLKLGDTQVLKKDFPPAFKGFWRVVYADSDLRVFFTNKGNLFALGKVSEDSTTYTNWSRFDSKTFK